MKWNETNTLKDILIFWGETTFFFIFAEIWRRSSKRALKCFRLEFLLSWQQQVQLWRTLPSFSFSLSVFLSSFPSLFLFRSLYQSSLLGRLKCHSHFRFLTHSFFLTHTFSSSQTFYSLSFFLSFSHSLIESSSF